MEEGIVKMLEDVKYKKKQSIQNKTQAEIQKFSQTNSAPEFRSK